MASGSVRFVAGPPLSFCTSSCGPGRFPCLQLGLSPASAWLLCTLRRGKGSCLSVRMEFPHFSAILEEQRATTPLIHPQSSALVPRRDRSCLQLPRAQSRGCVCWRSAGEAVARTWAAQELRTWALVTATLRGKGFMGHQG
jgi:hypothetical protein